MPDPAGLRRLTLADLDDDTLLELVRHGEDLLVERKREPPAPPKFGAAVGSLPNTLGGWVLLGVTDEGDVHGWQPPGGADIQSHLGAVLRAQLDPLPPFVAAMRNVAGKAIGVVRVFSSTDAPHIVRGTGAVYVRTSKGKEPVDDHRTLLELAKRGAVAEREAASRLTEPTTFVSPGRELESQHQDEVIIDVRAAPLTVTPSLAEWPFTRHAADACTVLIQNALPATRTGPEQIEHPWIDPSADRTVITGAHSRGFGESTRVSILARPAGLLAIEKLQRHGGDHPPVVLIQTLFEEELQPLARALVSLLEAAEAIGRSVADFWLILPAGGEVAGGRKHRLNGLSATGEITVPATGDEIEALAGRWFRQIQRNMGIVKFERES
jgi:hypothetical protein